MVAKVTEQTGCDIRDWLCDEFSTPEIASESSTVNATTGPQANTQTATPVSLTDQEMQNIPKNRAGNLSVTKITEAIAAKERAQTRGDQESCDRRSSTRTVLDSRIARI